MTDDQERSDDEVFEAVKETVSNVPGMEIMPQHEFDQVMAAMAEASDEREARDREAGKRFLDEERDREIIDAWYDDAKDMDLDRLPAFLANLVTGYHHDYGTIVHATAAASLAAANAVNHSETGGLTGFQAGCVMWAFIKRWMHMDGPLRIVNYNDMLFPQYERKFRSISTETWDHLQAEAKAKLVANPDAHPDVVAHWTTVAVGVVPFGFEIEAA